MKTLATRIVVLCIFTSVEKRWQEGFERRGLEEASELLRLKRKLVGTRVTHWSSQVHISSADGIFYRMCHEILQTSDGPHFCVR